MKKNSFLSQLYLICTLIILNSCQKKPEADFSMSNSNPLIEEEVQFTNNSKEAYDYQWDFGDGSTTNEKDPLHYYDESGIYTVKLKAFSKNGNKNSEISKQITVSNKITYKAMLGVWVMDSLYDNNNIDISSQINSYFPTIVDLDDMNSYESTLGTFAIYLIYGINNFGLTSHLFNKIFPYSAGFITVGEWFIDKNSFTDKFVLKFKLHYQTYPIFQEFHDTMNINVSNIINDMCEPVIYYTFYDIKVSFKNSYNKMIWEWDNTVTKEYHRRDQYGHFITFQEVTPINNEKCRLIFTKSDQSLNEIINQYLVSTQ